MSKDACLDSEIANMARNAGIVWFAEIFAMALAYLTSVVVARVLQPSLYGLFALATTIVNLCAIAAVFGMDHSVVRYLAYYRVRKESSNARGILHLATIVTLIGGLGIAVLVYRVSPVIESQVAKQVGLNSILKYSVFSIPLLGLGRIWLGALQGLQYADKRAVIERILGPSFKLIFMLVFLWMETGVLGAIFGFILSSAFVTAIAGVSIGCRMRTAIGKGQRRFQIGEWLEFSFPLFLQSLLYIPMVGSLDILILGYFMSSADVGTYNAALKIAPLTALPLLAFSRPFAPVIADLFGRGDLVGLHSMFKTITKWVFTLSLPICVGIWLVGGDLLSMFGGEYVAANTALVILATGRLVDAAAGPVGYVLMMTGHTRINLANSVILVLVDVLLAVILVPQFGMIGMAIAQAVSMSGINIVRLIELRVVLKMHPYRLDFLKPLLACAVAGSVAFFGIHLFSFDAVLLRVGLLCLLLGILYVFSLWSLGLSQDDKALMAALEQRLRS